MSGYEDKLPDPEYCDLMTVDEWLACVDLGGFIDYDGYGHPVKNDKVDESIRIHPSDRHKEIPQDATHIVWFNR